ncbi:MAG: hypothetical protein ACPG7F_08105 [Aggregatilineales bacterium]
MFKRLLILIVGLLLIIPAYAQDLSDEEMGYISVIDTALEVTFNADSFRLTGEQVIDQDIDVEGVPFESNITLLVEADYINVNGKQDTYLVMDQVVNQVSGGQTVDVMLIQEMLLLDSELFIRFSDISPASIASLYPASWISFEEEAANYQGLAIINGEQFLDLLDAQQLSAPFSSLSSIITEVTQQGSIEINEQMMDVYETTLDASLLFSDEYVDEAMGVVDFEAMGVDMSDISVEDGGFVRYVYFIGQDDGFIHRVESEITLGMTMNGTAMGVSSDVVLEQTMNQFFDYYDFNEDITLPTPDNS